MSHCVIYARKSTESEDRQALSIGSQISELRLLALRQNLTVDRVLEESHSAKAPGRPVFTSLMEEDDPIGRREIVQAISSNWTVENGKCVYLAKAPFSFLSSQPSSPVCMIRKSNQKESSAG